MGLLTTWQFQGGPANRKNPRLACLVPHPAPHKPLSANAFHIWSSWFRGSDPWGTKFLLLGSLFSFLLNYLFSCFSWHIPPVDLLPILSCSASFIPLFLYYLFSSSSFVWSFFRLSLAELSLVSALVYYCFSTYLFAWAISPLPWPTILDGLFSWALGLTYSETMSPLQVSCERSSFELSFGCLFSWATQSLLVAHLSYGPWTHLWPFAQLAQWLIFLYSEPVLLYDYQLLVN